MAKTLVVSDFNKDLRPISLTSTMSKIAESFVTEKALKPVVLSHIDPGQSIQASSRALPLRSSLSLCSTIGCAPPTALGQL